jgi:hypothetical protein
LNFIPDPLTTAVGVALRADGSLAVNAEVNCQGKSGFAGDDGRFTIPDLPTINGDITCTLFVINEAGELRGTAVATPVPGGITDFGEIMADQNPPDR